MVPQGLELFFLLFFYRHPHYLFDTTVCVLILLYMCPHNTVYVPSYYNICVLILLYMCPNTTVYVSSYYYMCGTGVQRHSYAASALPRGNLIRLGQPRDHSQVRHLPLYQTLSYECMRP
jgi:hypothetical protein